MHRPCTLCGKEGAHCSAVYRDGAEARVELEGGHLVHFDRTTRRALFSFQGRLLVESDGATVTREWSFPKRIHSCDGSRVICMEGEQWETQQLVVYELGD